MRTEQQIRERLEFWQGMLMGTQFGLIANQAELFTKLSPPWQRFALDLMQSPPELRSHVAHLQEKSLGVIVDTLKWVLGEDNFPNS